MATRARSGIAVIVALIIIAAIIAIAWPMWRAHQVQSRVTTALAAAAGAKLAVMEAQTIAGSVTKIRAAEVGYTDQAAARRPYVAQIRVGDGGTITVQTKDTGARPDPVLRLIPVAGATQLTWRCQLVAGQPSEAPADCAVSTAPPIAARSAAAPARSAAPLPAPAASAAPRLPPESSTPGSIK